MITREQVRKDCETTAMAHGNALEIIETFDEEEKRGLLHRRDYEDYINGLKRNLVSLEKARDDAYAQFKALLPPYDPDNHISGCGCITQNGKRVKWCGDHY